MKYQIKRIRKEKNISQQKCADDLGISIRTWRRYENGFTDPQVQILTKIAKYFSVEIEELILDSES